MVRDRSPVPGHTGQAFDDFLTSRLPPSTSRVQAIFRETTICYAYMCSYAYGCTERSGRPAQVLTRRCMRYMPETLRVKPALSEFSLDLLAKQRESGSRLSPTTTGILDELRPKGPLRKHS